MWIKENHSISLRQAKKCSNREAHQLTPVQACGCLQSLVHSSTSMEGSAPGSPGELSVRWVGRDPVCGILVVMTHRHHKGGFSPSNSGLHSVGSRQKRSHGWWLRAGALTESKQNCGARAVAWGWGASVASTDDGDVHGFRREQYLWRLVGKAKDTAEAEAHGTQESDKGPEDRAQGEGGPCMKQPTPLGLQERCSIRKNPGTTLMSLVISSLMRPQACAWVELAFKSSGPC